MIKIDQSEFEMWRSHFLHGNILIERSLFSKNCDIYFIKRRFFGFWNKHILITDEHLEVTPELVSQIEAAKYAMSFAKEKERTDLELARQAKFRKEIQDIKSGLHDS